MSEVVVNYVSSLPRFGEGKKKKKTNNNNNKKGRLKTKKGNLCKRRVKEKKRVREPSKLETRKSDLGKS